MSMIEHFHRTFTYDNWANREVLRSLGESSELPQRGLDLMGHILSAQKLWWERILARPQSLPVWASLTIKQCEAETSELEGLRRQYFTGRTDADLSKETNYKNSKGENWTSRVDDILTHMIMHSAYHRGQIAMVMRSAGITPAYTDFIHGVRQGLFE